MQFPFCKERSVLAADMMRAPCSSVSLPPPHVEVWWPLTIVSVITGSPWRLWVYIVYRIVHTVDSPQMSGEPERAREPLIRES